MINKRQLGIFCVLFTLNVGAHAASTDESELTNQATWQIPTQIDIESQLFAWVDSLSLDDDTATQLKQRWHNHKESADHLTVVAEIFSQVNDDAKNLFELCGSAKTNTKLPTFSTLTDEKAAPFLRNNLRLYYGQWLGLNQLFDETQQQLAGLNTEDVIDPATLLFFQAVSFHRLLQKDKCLPILEKLMEQPDAIPRRYATMARLMEVDLKPLKEDTLDEVSRLMDNIKVRLNHGRAGARVRKEEDAVIAKLDKMIEKLEEEAERARQAAQSQGSQSGGDRSAAPMQDSQIGPGQSGPGNVDPKKLGENVEWGDLPPKEREEALQKLSKGLPSHYRDVIEEYFQKLAKEER